MKRQEGLEINHAILLSGFYKELIGLDIIQYCYQGCIKSKDGLQINHAILLSGFHKELGRVGDKPILLSG